MSELFPENSDVRRGRHRGNYAVYGVVDQAFRKSPDAETTGCSLAAFARIVVAPEKDRSHVDLYADAGVTYTGLPAGRKSDIVGVAVAYVRFSSSLRQLDRDTIAFSGEAQPIRSSELVIEASCQVELAPWLKVQPFTQWIARPGGGEPDPDKPWRKIPNATVLGLRSVAVF